MKYNCVVCIKQVPDTKRITGDAMTEDGTVNRGALPAIFNPDDLHALEEAQAIRDEHGGTVTVLTMGRASACDQLREALYRGADRAILLSDIRAAVSDTLATSYILSCAVKKLSPDIVFCGRQAIDGDTAQVGPQLAQKLQFPVICYLEQLIGLQDGKITVRRNVGNGWEVVSAKLPVLVTVIGGANIPRPPSAKRMMKYKKALGPSELAAQVGKGMPDAGEQERADEIKKRCDALEKRGLLLEQWNLDDLEIDMAWCGRGGSPTKVHRVQYVVLAGGEYHEFSPTDDGVAELVGELIEDHTIG